MTVFWHTFAHIKLLDDNRARWARPTMASRQCRAKITALRNPEPFALPPAGIRGSETKPIGKLQPRTVAENIAETMRRYQSRVGRLGRTDTGGIRSGPSLRIAGLFRLNVEAVSRSESRMRVGPLVGVRRAVDHRSSAARTAPEPGSVLPGGGRPERVPPEHPGRREGTGPTGYTRSPFHRAWSPHRSG